MEREAAKTLWKYRQKPVERTQKTPSDDGTRTAHSCLVARYRGQVFGHVVAAIHGAPVVVSLGYHFASWG